MKSKAYIFAVAFLFATLFSLPTTAQTLKDFRQKLEYERPDDPFNRADVTIREDDSARIALAELASKSEESVIEGYRIGIFFDNGASARANAMEVLKQCEELFADIPTTMSYDNPYFKVSAGYCINTEEAIIMLNRIQKHFPKAYLMRERITPSDIMVARDKERNFVEVGDQAASGAAAESAE